MATRDRPAESLYTRLLSRGSLKDVGMNQVKFCRFGNDKDSIGTSGLGGCHVASVASQTGAILIHISPRNPDPNSTLDGDAWIGFKMDEFARLFVEKRAELVSSPAAALTAQAHVVFDNRITHPVHHQHQIICARLVAMGLSVQVEGSYPAGSQPRYMGRNELVILKTSNTDIPVMYLEDNIVQPNNWTLVDVGNSTGQWQYWDGERHVPWTIDATRRFWVRWTGSGWESGGRRT